MSLDVRIRNEGTILAFWVLTQEAREWVSANVDVPDYMRLGADGFAVQHSLADGIVSAMLNEGLRVGR